MITKRRFETEVGRTLSVRKTSRRLSCRPCYLQRVSVHHKDGLTLELLIRSYCLLIHRLGAPSPPPITPLLHSLVNPPDASAPDAGTQFACVLFAHLVRSAPAAKVCSRIAGG